MSALREEIVEAEKARTDLLKWKLIIVSGLGAAGLGFTGQSNVPGAPFVLLLIPGVCLYVYLMCRHLTLRIMVIGIFLRHHGQDDEKPYERFVSGIRGKSAFALEDWALEYSTFALSSLVIVAGFVLPFIEVTGDASCVVGGGIMKPLSVISGLAGFILALFIKHGYSRRLENLEREGRSSLAGEQRA